MTTFQLPIVLSKLGKAEGVLPTPAGRSPGRQALTSDLQSCGAQACCSSSHKLLAVEPALNARHGSPSCHTLPGPAGYYGSIEGEERPGLCSRHSDGTEDQEKDEAYVIENGLVGWAGQVRPAGGDTEERQHGDEAEC